MIEKNHPYIDELGFVPNNNRFKILSKNGFKSFIGVKKTNKQSKMLKLFINNNSFIITTLDHKLFINKDDYKIAKEFNIGDPVYTSKGIQFITNIIETTSEATYDILHIEDDHCYFVKSDKEQILIHQCLYIDELGFVPAAEEFYESVYPTISSSDTSKVIITSTPKGLNFFYKMWIEAETGRNEYVAYDVKWFEHPDRDQSWYDSQVANLNAKSVDQEINCVAGDTKLNLNGESVTIKAIYDKYKKLNASDNKGVIYVQDVSYTIGK